MTLQASAGREFSARLAVQKQSSNSTWPPCDKGLLAPFDILNSA